MMAQTENILSMRKNRFMRLRHDLERLRNLCYLVSRREKLKRQYIGINRECFRNQEEYLNKYKANIGNENLVNASDSTSLTPTHRSTYRIREILQIKNEKCLYDFPEKWSEQHQEQIVQLEESLYNEKSQNPSNLNKLKIKL